MNLPLIDASFDNVNYKITTNCEAYEVPSVHIASISSPNGSHNCGWSMRCILHCHLLKIKFIAYRTPIDSIGSIGNMSEEIKKYWVYDKIPPFVWVDGEYFGAYYELLERFPVS